MKCSNLHPPSCAQRPQANSHSLVVQIYCFRGKEAVLAPFFPESLALTTKGFNKIKHFSGYHYFSIHSNEKGSGSCLLCLTLCCLLASVSLLYHQFSFLLKKGEKKDRRVFFKIPCHIHSLFYLTFDKHVFVTFHGRRSL